ncbi:hypothetical protein N825_07015 [Skermanella stibiiresistens SB22]|uniref:Uncharacterized protein n=1 Tax=Skermanella stibiiresistens SB22 TaxID=1385369 RepID=W9H6V5_9PROT|nr:hypothetical protein N825_07015 [Skermanella stibiiresistens SB22]
MTEKQKGLTTPRGHPATGRNVPRNVGEKGTATQENRQSARHNLIGQASDGI